MNIIDNRNRTAWPLIGIHNFSQISKYKKSLNNLFSNFEQVTLPEELGIQYFKVSKMELSSLTFFQSKITLPWIGTNIIPSDECRNLVMNTIKPIYQFNYFDDDFDFLIVSPYQTKRQLVLDETSAIYLIMFYLSNLVRYNPSYLEELLSKKEAWIIESFIKTCSLTFLRAMVSRIVNVDYIIGKR